MDFSFDRLIYKHEFCNYLNEQKTLLTSINRGGKIKVYGPRNFGKTSLVKNISALNWQNELPEKRIILYVDLYSVTTLDDISEEIYRAFQLAMNEKKSVVQSMFKILKSFKYLRPTFKIDKESENYAFTNVFNEINQLSLKFKLEFLIILDEFQEISKIKKAEAKLRGALQELGDKIPVVILGSKQHMLLEIFEKPKAPFYSWGETIELRPIEYSVYNQYINERLYQKIDEEAGKYLQDMLHRIPESINRFCDYLNKNKTKKVINDAYINSMLDDFIGSSRTIYEEIYANLSRMEKRVFRAIAIAKNSKIIKPTGKDFLKSVPEVSKATVAQIVIKGLDDAILSREISDNSEFVYFITDPFFNHFLKKFKF